MTLGGTQVDGELLPSVELDIHLEIYKTFPQVNGIAHTSTPIWVNGSTQGDHFHREIPCLPYLSKEEIEVNDEQIPANKSLRISQGITLKQCG